MEVQGHRSSSVGALLFLLVSLEGVCCQSNIITFSVKEEQAARTPVGNVAEQSGFGANSGYVYQMLGSDMTSSLFTLEADSGLLSTSVMVDREVVCTDASQGTCQLSLDIAIKQDTTVIASPEVIITVEDINDNPPQFEVSEATLYISESAPVGTEVTMSGAVDADWGIGDTLTYWMDESDVFELQEDKLLDTSFLKLVTLQALDRETENAYFFNIYARDGNTSASLTGSVVVTMIVTDTNDHGPEFTEPQFSFKVQENAGVGSLIGTISATDKDSDENGRVTYHFSSQTSSSILELFYLDENSGEVRVQSVLQYESGKTFQAIVEAKDHAESPRAAQVVLDIFVEDAGNTPPRLSVTLENSWGPDGTRIAEDLPEGSFVGTLKYEDNDEGDAGIVTCASLNSYFTLQPLDDNKYTIDIKVALDRESQGEILVVLMCTDNGNPSLSGMANFTAYVTDVNDNHPVFESSDYTATVQEMVASQASLVQVSAKDEDADENSEIRYQLTANSSNAFSVDPFSGWLSLISPVDREAGPVIPLTVLAVDGGNPTLTGSVTVSIFVEDVNDNSPEIIQHEYQVRENEDPGSFVAQVIGSDSDDGINGELRYRLVSDPSGGFLVSDSGMITTTKIFDRESVDHYNLLIEVFDKGEPSLSSTDSITIEITDSNDHSPKFEYPVPGDDTVTVSADISPGKVVAKATAFDEDTDKNAQLLYLIAEGNPTRLFSIDNSTGTVFVAKRLTTSRETSHRLTISVQDSGSPRLHNSSFLYIQVDFTNATIAGQGDDSEQQRYVVIAGVIAGVTLVIAIIIIATILKLRHMDITNCATQSGKVKSSHAPMPPPTTASSVKISGPLAVYAADHDDKEAGFGDDRFSEVGDRHLSEFSTFSGRSGFNQVSMVGAGHPDGMDERDGRRSVLAPIDGRSPSGSEDVTSDSSADVTTSDSGRGGSDTEDLPSGGALTMDQAPGVPPRHPIGVSSFKPGPAGPSPHSQQDLSNLGCLPRSARAYASHKDFPKSKRPAGKVRFSMDDHEVGKAGGPPRVYWTGNGRDQDTHGTPHVQNQSPYLYGDPARNRGGAGNFGPGLQPPPSHPSRPTQSRQDLHNLVRSRSPIPTSSTASSPPSSQPDLFLGLNISVDENPVKNNSNTNNFNKPPHQPKFIAPPTPGSAYFNPNFPLLPHQRPHPSSSAPSRVLLPPSNVSVDEDDDDGGSTTTSGSYAVDDNFLNISVEC